MKKFAKKIYKYDPEMCAIEKMAEIGGKTQRDLRYITLKTVIITTVNITTVARR